VNSCVCNPGWKGSTCNISYCPNNCNLNGFCNNVTQQCMCNPGYFGGDCAKLNATYCSKSIILTGSSGQFQDHFSNDDPLGVSYLPNSNCLWTINTNQNSPTTVTLERHQVQEDVDIIKVFDGFSNNGTLIAIWSTDGFPVNPVVTSGSIVTLQFLSDSSCQMTGFTSFWTSNVLCLNGCSGAGYCVSGTCHCQNGYTGPDCSQIATLIPLLSGDPYFDYVGEYEWKFYYFDIPANVQLVMVQYEKTLFPIPPVARWGGGHPIFFLRYNFYPTIYHFDDAGDYFDNETILSFDNPPQGRWAVGVYGLEASGFVLTLSPFLYTSQGINPMQDSFGGFIAGMVILAVGIVSVLAIIIAVVIWYRRRLGGRVFKEMKEESSIPRDSTTN